MIFLVKFVKKKERSNMNIFCCYWSQVLEWKRKWSSQKYQKNMNMYFATFTYSVMQLIIIFPNEGKKDEVN